MHFCVCLCACVCMGPSVVLVRLHAYLMRIMRVDYSGQPEVSDLEQQLVRVDKCVGWLQVSVQDVGRVDKLQSPQQLVEQQSSMTCSRAKIKSAHHDVPQCPYAMYKHIFSSLKNIYYHVWI